MIPEVGFQDFVGKTIDRIDDDCINSVTFYFTDGTSQKVFAECGSMPSDIPFFDFEGG